MAVPIHVTFNTLKTVHKELFEQIYQLIRNSREAFCNRFNLLRQFKQKILIVIQVFHLLLLEYYCQTKLEIF